MFELVNLNKNEIEKQSVKTLRFVRLFISYIFLLKNERVQTFEKFMSETRKVWEIYKKYPEFSQNLVKLKYQLILINF